MLLLVVLVLFGPKRLPEIGRNLGKGMRDFKGALTDDDKSDRQSNAEVVEDDEPPMTRSRRSRNASL